MPALPHNHAVHPIRALELSAIDAVGFDLDHTLALYDDESVNRLAAEETFSILKQSGYSVSPLPLEIRASQARGLSMDLRHGNVLKIGADGAVKLARCGGTWLTDDDIHTRYQAYDPADETLSWHVNSPFDTPTLWFFSVLGPSIAGAREANYAATLLRDIRTSLDASHTRGELKHRIARELERFITPAGNIEDGLRRWKEAGKILFVVTNSDRAYATRVLDHVLPSWRDIFDIVVTDASKPRFFTETASSPWPARESAGVRVVHGVTAIQLEEQLRVSRERILYAGDNARADIVPARRHGWKTVHVVAELSVVHDASPWSGALEHGGNPTWFARKIRDHADAACTRIDSLLAIDPSRRIPVNGDFYASVNRALRGLAPAPDAP